MTTKSGRSARGFGAIPRTWAASISLLLVLLILAATLLPGPTPRAGVRAWRWLCVGCGDRDLADALANILLFLPLGAFLGMAVGSRGRAVLLITALSLGIEVAQARIPGRFPTGTDVLFNTIGGGAGALLMSYYRFWLRPGVRTLGWFRMASWVGGLAVVAATGALNRLSFPGSTYFVQWTADLGGLEHYRGRMEQASLGGAPSVPGPANSASGLALAESLRRGAPLQVRFQAGEPPLGVAPLWSVYDERGREIALLGVDRSDLVLRQRRRAADLGLDQMDHRLRGALGGLEPGNVVAARAWRDEQGTLCLAANAASACRLGPTAGTGWALVFFSERMPAWLISLLGPLWLMLLFLPAGFFGVSRRDLAGRTLSPVPILIVTCALVLMGPAVGLVRTPAVEIAGAATGLVVGALLRRFITDRSPGAGLEGHAV